MLIIAAMMPSWYTAFSTRQWLGRTFCARNLVLVGIFCLVLAGEFYFGWIEMAVGAYLASTNSRRPESGTVWQWRHKTLQARRKLESLVTNPDFTEDSDDDVRGLARIFGQAASGSPVMLAAGRFISLYRRLPPQLGEEIASAFELLNLQTGRNWTRTYVEADGNGVTLYHLDQGNQVLSKTHIGPELLEYLARGQAMVPGSLESMQDFRGHIFPAADFFKALMKLPENVSRKVIERPDALLEFGPRILRAGISSEDSADKVTIGFEIELDGRSQVMMLQADKEAVSRLRRLLAGSDPKRGNKAGAR